MKYLPLFFLVAVSAVAQQKPKIYDCFKVQSMIRADEEHYWTAWTNKCPYTIDSVYVMVAFSDTTNKPLGGGVWGLHYITPGSHRVNRFSTPSGVPDFKFVKVQKITADPGEALVHSPEVKARLAPGLVGDPGERVPGQQ